MPSRRILQLGDPVLRERSQVVPSPAHVTPILKDLRGTLHEFQRTHGFGRGISAIQIGEPWRVIYLEFEANPYSLVNPVFDRLGGERIRLWDDCFSFPDLLVRVTRAYEVTVAYEDLRGKPHVLQCQGPMAELMQHEMDHLDGILAVDRAIDRDSLRTREEHQRRLSSPLSDLRSQQGAASR